MTTTSKDRDAIPNSTLLPSLSFEDIKDKDANSEEDGTWQIALVFDKGKIPHPVVPRKPGTVHLKGYLLLSLPHGKFPKIPLYDMNRFDDLVRTWVTEQYTLDHGATTELGKLSLYSSKNLFLIAPELKPWNKKTEIFLRGIFLWWGLDDFLAHSVLRSSPILTKDHFSDLTKFITNIMTGLYRHLDCIPNLDIPFLNSALKALFYIYKELSEQVAGYEKYHTHLLRELVNWIQFYKVWAIYKGSNWDPIHQPQLVSRKLSGKRAIIELIQLVTATYVDDSVREHVLFNLFCESGDLINNLTYDVFTLNRSSESRIACRNVLLRNIREGGISFEQCLSSHLLTLNNEIINFCKIAKALSVEFSNSEPLQKYVRNFQYFVDGSILYFAREERYGKCDYKIMKVVKGNGSQAK